MVAAAEVDSAAVAAATVSDEIRGSGFNCAYVKKRKRRPETGETISNGRRKGLL